MYYFTHISNNLSFKNKLERDVFNFLKTKERKVVDEKDLRAFKESIIDGIDSICADHPRCKPIKADFWGPHKYVNTDDKDIQLHVGGFVSFHLYSSND